MKRRRRAETALNLAQVWGARRALLGRSGLHLVTLGMVILSFWLLASFVGQVVIGAQMNRRGDEQRAENARLVAENVQLATAVAYANSPAYAEQTARDQLGYAKDGDVIVLPNIAQPTPVVAQPTPAALIAPTPEPNWRGWTQALFPPPSR